MDAVLEFYGRMSAYELSTLTHLEEPWKHGRKGVREGAPSTKVILQAWMAEYYSSLTPANLPSDVG